MGDALHTPGLALCARAGDIHDIAPSGRSGLAEATSPRVETKGGVAEPRGNYALRIEYSGAKSENSSYFGIFNSRRVKIGLYPHEVGKIGLIRPIFSCFCAISGY
jgi:hypothetical protein